MRINNIKLSGFRCYQLAEVSELKKYNVFGGLNGSGKSSLIDALEYFFTGSCRGTDEGGKGADSLRCDVPAKFPLSNTIELGLIPERTKVVTFARGIGQGPKSQAAEKISKLCGEVGARYLKAMTQPGTFLELKDGEQRKMLLDLTQAELTEEQVMALVPQHLQPYVSISLLRRPEGIETEERQLREARPGLKRALAERVYAPAAVEDPNLGPDETAEGVRRESKELLETLAQEREGLIRQESDQEARLDMLTRQRDRAADELKSVTDHPPVDVADVEAHLAESEKALEAALKEERENRDRLMALIKRRGELEGRLTTERSAERQLAGLGRQCPTCLRAIEKVHYDEVMSGFKQTISKLEAELSKVNQETVNMQPQLDRPALEEDVAILREALEQAGSWSERQITAEKQLRQAEAELKAHSGIEDPAAKIEALSQRIERGGKYLAQLEAWISEQQRKQQITEARAQIEQNIKDHDELIELLGAKGPLKAALAGLPGMTGLLQEVSHLLRGFGLPAVRLSREDEGWDIYVGERKAKLLSASERYRLSLAFAAIFARKAGLGILFLDAADILDAEQKDALIAVLEGAQLEQAFVTVTREPFEEQSAEGDWAFYNVRKNQAGVAVIVPAKIAEAAAS